MVTATPSEPEAPEPPDWSERDDVSTSSITTPSPPASAAPAKHELAPQASDAAPRVESESVDAVWAEVLAHLRPKSSIYSLVSKLRLTEITAARVCLRGGAAAVGMQASYIPALTDAFAKVLNRSINVQILAGEVTTPAAPQGAKPPLAPRADPHLAPQPMCGAPKVAPTPNRVANAQELQAQAHPLVQKAVVLFAGRVSKTTLRKDTTGVTPERTAPAADVESPDAGLPLAPGAFNPALSPDDMIDD